MNLVNNLRYGEISRKTAGRFDTEYYSQGAFSFRNMQTGILGDASRRPPLREVLIKNSGSVLQGVEFFDIREFIMSDEMSYIVGLASDKYYIMKQYIDYWEVVASQVYPNVGVSAGEDTPIILTEKMAHEIRSTQYYTRMYFVHHSFKPFYIDYNGNDLFESATVNIIRNQDGKNQFNFTPQIVKNDAGAELPYFEKRLVYYNEKDQSWYFTKDFAEGTKYEYNEKYPVVKGGATYINNYEEQRDDNLLLGKGNYPSVVAIINDCLYFAATDNEPQAVWKSRIFGTSQFTEEDSLHDFVTYQSVVTETDELVDIDDIPKIDMTNTAGDIIYETGPAGEKIYYAPFGKQVYPTTIDGKTVYFYDTAFTKKANYQVAVSVTDLDNVTILREDAEYVERLEAKPIPSGGGQLEFFWKYDGSKYNYNISIDKYKPQQKPLQTYDFSDPNKLIRKNVRVDFVTTDSCGDKIEMNSGRRDRIMYIKQSCGKIILGTTTGEELLPTNFSPVSNRKREHYSDYGSISEYSIDPISVNSSFIFIQKSNILRELYLYQGFINAQDASMLNHDILKGKIVSIEVRNIPVPTLYILKDDGSLVVLFYDKNNGIQSFSRWDSTGKIKSITKMEDGNDTFLYCLVEKTNADGETHRAICYLDENATSYWDFEHIGHEGEVVGDNYISEIVTPYAEIIDNEYIGFGNFKKANHAYARCYNTGSISVGDDLDQMTTYYDIGNKDQRMVITGSSSDQYSMIIRAVDNEPMNILAFGYEVIKR